MIFKQKRRINMEPLFENKEEEILKKLRQLPSSTIHEAAGKIGNLPSEIKPLSNSMKLCGFATTVLSPPGDNLWIHRAMYQAKPGDILVIDVGISYEHGYWGEIMTFAAIHQGLKGLVINGCVRDLDRLLELKFPIFSRGICMRGTDKNKGIQGAINSPARMGNAIVFPGDLIVGDSDGVVVIPRSEIATIAESSKQREENETGMIAEISRGKSTLDIYDLH
jgi:4-hydroxy-4-methyl-2-oxoglutarate aldolase